MLTYHYAQTPSQSLDFAVMLGNREISSHVSDTLNRYLDIEILLAPSSNLLKKCGHHHGNLDSYSVSKGK